VGLYDVQEMLIALLLFSIGFAVVTGVMLILLFFSWGIDRALAWILSDTPHSAQRLHHIH
jgi:hypothetical protein